VERKIALSLDGKRDRVRVQVLLGYGLKELLSG
jgi:hypothetical protein